MKLNFDQSNVLRLKIKSNLTWRTFTYFCSPILLMKLFVFMFYSNTWIHYPSQLIKQDRCWPIFQSSNLTSTHFSTSRWFITLCIVFSVYLLIFAKNLPRHYSCLPLPFTNTISSLSMHTFLYLLHLLFYLVFRTQNNKN